MQGCMLGNRCQNPVTSSALIQELRSEAFRMAIINVPADNEMQQQLVERLALKQRNIWTKYLKA